MRGAAHLQCYLDWKRTIAAKEDIFLKRLLEALQIWYSLQARSVAVACWQGILQIQSNVGCSTISRTTRDRLVEQVLGPLLPAQGAVEPVLLPLQGAGVLNK